MKNPVSGTFRSLRSFNFRLWTAGGLVSNAGTWMQRVAQDWLMLTQLTHHDASALGMVMGLRHSPAPGLARDFSPDAHHHSSLPQQLGLGDTW
jgi:hypothetical protein